MDNNELENQVERGSMFTHSALSGLSARLNEIESFLYGIIEVLTMKGITPPDEFKQVVEKVRNEMIEKGEMAYSGLALRVDSKRDDEIAPINCNERIHICQAVCCKLDFALSAKEVESGRFRPVHSLSQPCVFSPQSGRSPSSPCPSPSPSP